MACSNCGFNVKPGAKFCPNCGAKIEAQSPAPAPVQESVPAPKPVEPAPAPASQPAPAPAPQPAPQEAAVAPQVVQPTVPPMQRGPLGKAWDDIRATPQMLVQLLKLMGMNILPIIGFYVSGYMAQWGADVANGERKSMPKGKFSHRQLLLGFFMTVISFLVHIATFWLFLINFIPVIGWIVSFAAGLFVDAMVALAYIRMAQYGNVANGFDLSDVVRAMRKKPATLICCSFIPNLIVSACTFVAMLIIIIILAPVMMGAAQGLLSYLQDAPYMMLAGEQINPFGFIQTIISVLGVWVMFFVALAMFASTFAKLWSLRAVGHYVATFVPEWAQEAKQDK